MFNISKQGVLQWLWAGHCSGINSIPFYSCGPPNTGSVSFNVSAHEILQWQWQGQCSGIRLQDSNETENYSRSSRRHMPARITDTRPFA